MNSNTMNGNCEHAKGGGCGCIVQLHLLLDSHVSQLHAHKGPPYNYGEHAYGTDPVYARLLLLFFLQ
jgi:hypothetical protein